MRTEKTSAHSPKDVPFGKLKFASPAIRLHARNKALVNQVETDLLGAFNSNDFVEDKGHVLD